ncbi:MAG: F0F1 ATP synthase subunit B [Patescibacteria group bacterium]|nr:F0F1 ATP synthase subunit B [Patescibacteria group bacterium]MCL5095336.1 F0F1 ATP synthase subunit B [Patescibacteria group bacterium]
MESLGLDIKLLLAQVVNFLVLLFVLKKFLYRPILKVLDERKKKIEDSLANAEKINKELVKLEEEKAKILKAAQTEAVKLIAEEKKFAEEQKEKIIEEAKMKAVEEVAKGSVLAKQELEKAKKELREEVLRLTEVMTRKVLSRGLSDQEKHELIKKAIEE